MEASEKKRSRSQTALFFLQGCGRACVRVRVCECVCERISPSPPPTPLAAPSLAMSGEASLASMVDGEREEAHGRRFLFFVSSRLALTHSPTITPQAPSPSSPMTAGTWW
jgi:hypothetical protein